MILGGAALSAAIKTLFSIRAECMRENYLVREDVEHDKRGFSRVAAACESPARKCRVKWNQCASPVGMTPVLTHTL
jgi:hypothetical protein